MHFNVLSSEAMGPSVSPPALGPWHFATHAIPVVTPLYLSYINEIQVYVIVVN
jgi:hypothetical protein